jgi:hypothetical protein
MIICCVSIPALCTACGTSRSGSMSPITEATSGTEAGTQAGAAGQDLTARFKDDLAAFSRNRSHIEYEDVTVDATGHRGQSRVTWYKSGLGKQRIDATMSLPTGTDDETFSLILDASDLQYVCSAGTPQHPAAMCSTDSNAKDVGYLLLLVLGPPVVPDAVTRDLHATATSHTRIADRDATCYQFESATQPGKDSGTACFGAGLLLRFTQYLDANAYRFDLMATGIEDVPADSIIFDPPYPVKVSTETPAAISP